MPVNKHLKRKQIEDKLEDDTGAKKVKVSHRSHGQVAGQVLVLGQGDVGQLGLGQDIIERKKPAHVPLPEKIVQVFAGGMHTVCLSATGNVYTFGCNDEGALGRPTSKEGSEMVPEKVALDEKVVQVSAGDSHTAALTEDGTVYIWGTFRDSSGDIGLLEPMKSENLPTKVPVTEAVMKIASGNDHLIMVTKEGNLYSCGNAEQGQLGRVAATFVNRGGRRGLRYLLQPKMIYLKKKICFKDAFCGSYHTFAVSNEDNVYGFGLTNYNQLGTEDRRPRFFPESITKFKIDPLCWLGFSGGQHHSLCVDSEGQVYSLGRADYGRLGLGPGAEETGNPTLVKGIEPASGVTCGAAVSYAVTKDGSVYAWGMGTNMQLGTGEEEDAWSPVKMTGKQLENRAVLMASSGGQHTVLLAKEKQES